MFKSAAIMLCVGIAIISTSSCKDLKPNAPIEEEMKDSIKKIVPGIRYIGIHIEEHQDITVTLGSQKLFKQNEEKHQSLTKHLADMTVHYFEENNYLDEGKVIFVPNETTLPTEDDPKKEYNMNLQDLLKK